jgi:hypothetical protein
MNRLTLGMVPLLALLLLGSCSTEPTDDLRNGIDKLVAEPTNLSLAPGQTKTVEVGAVDAQGNQLDLAYDVTSVGAGLTVRRDSTFRPQFVNDTTLVVPPTAPRFRFVVTAAEGNSFQNTSFTVTSSGKELVIPVNIEPTTTIEATFSNATPALGEVVTLTMPPGLTLTPDATVSFADESLIPVIVARAPDGTSISFLVPPNRGGPLTINGVVSSVAPDVVFAPQTSTPLTTPVVDSIDAVFSTATPGIGQTVTLTLPAPIKFQDASTLTFGGQVATPEAVTVAPDSTSLTFEAPPNAVGAARVDSLVFPGDFVLSLPTRSGITVPTVGDCTPTGCTANVTFSDNAPDLGELVTATAPAGFRFAQDLVDPETEEVTPLTTLTFGTKIGAVQSIAADSTSLTFIALPGTVSNAVVTGLRPAVAPQFLVTLPTVDSITTNEISPLPNADDPQTAPALTVPAPGGTSTLFDAGPYNSAGDCCFGFPARLYKLVVTEAMTLTFTLDWYEGQDLGIYPTLDGIELLCPEDFSCLGDAGGEGSHPETTTVDFAPGTYFIAIPNFSDTNPNLFKLTIERP